VREVDALVGEIERSVVNGEIRGRHREVGGCGIDGSEAEIVAGRTAVRAGARR
jgi:hypothetical protein